MITPRPMAPVSATMSTCWTSPTRTCWRWRSSTGLPGRPSTSAMLAAIRLWKCWRSRVASLGGPFTPWWPPGARATRQFWWRAQIRSAVSWGGRRGSRAWNRLWRPLGHGSRDFQPATEGMQEDPRPAERSALPLEAVADLYTGAAEAASSVAILVIVARPFELTYLKGLHF